MIDVRRRVDRFNKFGPPKSEAGTRTIPMSPLLLNTLKAWRLACPKGELDLIFPNGAGNVENHGNLLSRVFWPIQIAAGVTVLRDGRPDAKYARPSPCLRRAVDRARLRPEADPGADGTFLHHTDL